MTAAKFSDTDETSQGSDDLLFDLRIDGKLIKARPEETVLSAALRQGIDFPNQCRVGGCGTCRCKLLNGSVDEFTDKSYVLSPDEVSAGYFLACQSTARSSLQIQLKESNLKPRQSLRIEATYSELERAEREEASLFQYLKFMLFSFVGLYSAASILAGGFSSTWGLITVLLFYILGDAIAGDDVSTPNYRRPVILTVQLWLAFPILLLIVFAALWSVSPGDPFGFGSWLSALSGYDLSAAKETNRWPHFLSTVVLTGLMVGLIGTITAHELTHRTWDKVSMWIGRQLLAFSFDTSFAIEHVYGHHRYVSTTADPATSPRGRNAYTHILCSTVKGNVSAWNIEKARLTANTRPIWSLHNFFLRGHLLSLCWWACAFFIGGLNAGLMFLLVGLWGKALLEIVNYMEHYGLVRDPVDPVEPHHSWNSNRRISSWTMFNLTRHSHHHASGEIPYHDLKPYPKAPQMIGGYLTTLVIAMIPPLWFYLMTDKIEDWDQHFATEKERRLVKRP